MSRDTKPAVAWWFVGALAAIKLAVHLYAIRGYGIFRDELYYLACARQLDWGYVDHPALSIFVLRMIETMFGNSLFAIRIVPALAGTATILVVAATACAMGGGRLAQSIAAAATLIAPMYLGTHHVYSMNAFSPLVWATAAFLAVTLIVEQKARTWIAIGVLLAIGLANKIDVLWLGAGLAAGLLIEPERKWFRTRWPWLGAGIAFCGLAPYVLWQVAHEWPTLEFIENATTLKMTGVSAGEFVGGQIEGMHPFTAPVWFAGLLTLLFFPAVRRFRLIAWTFLTVALILIASGTSRSIYLAPAYTWLFPAGGIGLAALLGRLRIRWVGWSAIPVMLAGGAAIAPFALPVLPVETYLRYADRLGVRPSTEEVKEVGEMPQFYADMNGWDQIAGSVIEAARTLPEFEREALYVFAPDYGVAGAIDYFGARHGLRAISGHNSYWIWGPGDFDGSVLVEVGGTRERLETLFESVERAGETRCDYCMPYENGLPIWICRNAKVDVADAWPVVKHYD